MTDKTYKIQEDNNGRLNFTLPKALGTALQLKKGDSVKFLIDRGDLVIKKVN